MQKSVTGELRREHRVEEDPSLRRGATFVWRGQQASGIEHRQDSKLAAPKQATAKAFLASANEGSSTLCSSLVLVAVSKIRGA